MKRRIRALVHPMRSWRGIGAAAALWALLASPLFALQATLWPVCTMSCSLEGGSCCCKSLGVRGFLPQGEDGAFDKPRFSPSQDACPSPAAPFEPKGPKAFLRRAPSTALVVPAATWMRPNGSLLPYLAERPFALLPRPPPQSV